MESGPSASQGAGEAPGKVAAPFSATPLRSGTAPEPAVFDWSSLKAVGSFLGIVGTGGGGFAALSFGLGYLAVKNHDEMVGLPSTVVSNTTYVRNGALFFPNSLYYLFSSVILDVFIAGVAALVVWLALTLVSRVSPVKQSLRRLGDSVTKSTSESVLFVLTQLGLLVLGIYLLHVQVAAFDAENRDLLYKQNVVRTASPGTTASHTWWETLRGRLRSLRIDLGLQQSSELALRVREDLQRIDGAERLQMRYGRQLGLLVLLVYGVFALRRWRRSLRGRLSLPSARGAVSAGPRSFVLIDWIVYPLLFGLMVAVVLNLPATYGILCLSNAGTWVVIFDSTHSAGESGYLLSDLSSDPKEIWILGYDNKASRWELRVLEREKVQQVRIVEANNTRNILSKVGAKPQQ